MARAVHVPYTVEQDEDGIWCAHAQLRPGSTRRRLLLNSQRPSLRLAPGFARPSM
jgi:hypothetical protein